MSNLDVSVLFVTALFLYRLLSAVVTLPLASHISERLSNFYSQNYCVMKTIELEYK